MSSLISSACVLDRHTLAGLGSRSHLAASSIVLSSVTSPVGCRPNKHCRLGGFRFDVCQYGSPSVSSSSTVKPEVIAGIFQSSVRLSLKPLLMQADERVEFSDSNLIAERLLGNLFQSNIGRHTSADMKVIKQKQLGFDHTRNRTPTILSVQETRS